MPIFFLLLIGLDIFLEIIDFEFYLDLFVFKANFLLTDMVFKLANFMLIFWNDHLTFLEVSFKVLSLFKQAFFKAFLLGCLFLDDF